MSHPRPYYHEFAWAYDLLQADQIAHRLDFIQAVLSEHGVGAGCRILDAGCGTGRYTAGLASRGFRALGADRSRDLIAVARARETDRAHSPGFVIADLLNISFGCPFDAVLCRGVLNDFVEETDRRSIFLQFAAWLRGGGIVIFDVREWTRTLARYSKAPLHRRTIELLNGVLRFQSETALDIESHRLLVQERFDLEAVGVRTAIENDFIMRCWTPDEVFTHLSKAGLEHIGRHSAYGEGDRAWSDRLVIVARKA